MKEFIIVTGATGCVGRQVTESLLAAGHTVKVVGRNPERLKMLAKRGAEVCSGSLDDRTFLTDAFRGARAVLVMSPVNIKAKDVNAEQKKNVKDIAGAVRDSGVKHVVALSSWGLETPDRIGAMVGCHWLEQDLDAISGLNVVHLRPAWYMENFLWNIGLIKMAGINGLALKADLPFPMIATRDVASVACSYLSSISFKDRNVHYLNGPRDYTMSEITRVLGASIGKPNLGYIEFPAGIFKKGLVGNGGLSLNAADMLIEINDAINSGRVKAVPRTDLNTTSTSLEEFAKNTFAPAFAEAPNPKFSEKLGGVALRSLLFVTGHHVKCSKSKSKCPIFNAVRQRCNSPKNQPIN